MPARRPKGVRDPAEIAFDVELGKRIAEERKFRGIGQLELSGLVGISPQQLSKYEQGTDRIAASRLKKLCLALAIEAGGLIDSISVDPVTKTVPASDENRNAMALFSRCDAESRDTVSRLLKLLAKS